MKLSICMMVKDEEKNLNRCLDSLEYLRKEVDSELIIVDTGSTDNTVEIAKQYTDKVYFHKWNNNFSDMRNITISYAKGEWIFIMDADEELKESDYILGFFKNENLSKEYNTVCIKARNFTSKETGSSYTEIISNRFFKNDGEFRYEGSVHNQAIYKEPVIKIESILFHYGYDNHDAELMEKKFNRTASILKNELKKDPDNIYYRYQLSASYGMYDKWEDALREGKKAFDLICKLGKKGMDTNFYIFSHMMIIYKKLDMYDEMIKISEKALNLRKKDIDSNFFMADAYVTKKEYKKAIEFYQVYINEVWKYKNAGFIEGFEVDVKLETLYFFEKAIFNFIYLLYNEERYFEIINVKNMISEKSRKAIYYLAKSYLNTENIDGLKSYYDESVGLKQEIIDSVEAIIFERSYEQSIKIMTAFSKGQENYSIFNKLRLYFQKQTSLTSREREKYEGVLLENYELLYSELFYHELKSENDINRAVRWIGNLKPEQILDEISNIARKYEDLNEYLKLNICSLDSDSIKKMKIKTEVEKYLILNNIDKDQKDYIDRFNDYTINGYKYVEAVYNGQLLEDEFFLSEIDNDEHKFYIYMNMSRNSDVLNAARFLRKALNVYPQMKKGIAMVADELKKSEKNDKKAYIDEMQRKIEEYLANGQIEKAKEALVYYEKLLKN